MELINHHPSFRGAVCLEFNSSRLPHDKSLAVNPFFDAHFWSKSGIQGGSLDSSWRNPSAQPSVVIADRLVLIGEKGFFGNQNSVARPTAANWNYTVQRLKERFGIA